MEDDTEDENEILYDSCGCFKDFTSILRQRYAKTPRNFLVGWNLIPTSELEKREPSPILHKHQDK